MAGNEGAAAIDSSRALVQDNPHMKIRIRKILIGAGAVLLAAGLVFLLVPAPINPAAYQPPPRPGLEGPLAPNSLLTGAAVLARGLLDGLETFTLDGAGSFY